MLSVPQALAEIFKLIQPLASETVALAQADRRVLAETMRAQRDQPPFAASAMDGYAVRAVDARVGNTLKVIGDAAAGRGFSGAVSDGEAVRIFTGAPVPEGADWVIIQEDVTRKANQITVNAAPGTSSHIRPAGGDFKAGDTVDAPRLLGPNDLALLAAMNIAQVSVARRPVVALIATGDELVMPGEVPGPGQIIASNSFGLAALACRAGAEARLLPIARDTPASLKTAFELAKGADLVVTIGGASVGEHDIVADVAAGLGMKPAFTKIAMRPGKPLMAGKLGNALHLGLPGNPVSAMVCGHIFMLPALRAMLGLPGEPAARKTATLTADIGANGAREHYMRATVSQGQITAFDRQDSALLGVLSQSNALLVRPVDDAARKAGDVVEYVPI